MADQTASEIGTETAACACMKRPEYSHFTQHGPKMCGSPIHGQFLLAPHVAERPSHD